MMKRIPATHIHRLAQAAESNAPLSLDQRAAKRPSPFIYADQSLHAIAKITADTP
jgi:hypothetical protein